MSLFGFLYIIRRGSAVANERDKRHSNSADSCCFAYHRFIDKCWYQDVWHAMSVTKKFKRRVIHYG